MHKINFVYSTSKYVLESMCKFMQQNIYVAENCERYFNLLYVGLFLYETHST